MLRPMAAAGALVGKSAINQQVNGAGLQKTVDTVFEGSVQPMLTAAWVNGTLVVVNCVGGCGSQKTTVVMKFGLWRMCEVSIYFRFWSARKDCEPVNIRELYKMEDLR